jgi:allophanate hydrolase
VNLLDLAAVAAPAGLRGDGLPFGATLVAPWGQDGRLAGFADLLHRTTTDRLGATPIAVRSTPAPAARKLSTSYGDWLPIAVVGAHLSGEPLNHQLTDAGAVLLQACRTAPIYRLFALPETTPPKPGLVRVGADSGTAIVVEVWALPRAAFGSFVARVPSPLVIGKIELEDGTRVSGYLCETIATSNALDISSFGGWRAFKNRGPSI